MCILSCETKRQNKCYKTVTVALYTFFIKQMNKKCQPVFISGDLCVLYEEEQAGELGSSFNRLKVNQTEKRNLRN